MQHLHSPAFFQVDVILVHVALQGLISEVSEKYSGPNLSQFCNTSKCTVALFPGIMHSANYALYWQTHIQFGSRECCVRYSVYLLTLCILKTRLGTKFVCWMQKFSIPTQLSCMHFRCIGNCSFIRLQLPWTFWACLAFGIIAKNQWRKTTDN